MAEPGADPMRPAPGVSPANPHDVVRASSYDRIYSTVREIPPGRVATYGRVAAAAGLPGRARLVGYALHALADGTSVPWHRVINARGRISLRRGSGADITQRIRLEAEGVEFDAGGRVSLAIYGWAFDR